MTFRKPLLVPNLYRFVISFAFLQCSLFGAQAQMRQIYKDADENNHIYKISFYSASEGYIAFGKWIGYTTDSGRTFTKKFITLTNVDFNGYAANVTFGFEINGVKAFNKDTVIAYGDYGLVPAILYSTNGGNNFKLIYHSQYIATQLLTGIMDMNFPQDNNIGYAVDANRILKTTNKGLTWTAILEGGANYFNNIESVDNNNVFIIRKNSSPLVFKTTNGGTSWITLNTPAGLVNYMSFISATKGWVNMIDNAGGKLYYTSNGGNSWTLKNLPDIAQFECTKMKFINDSVGYAISNRDYTSYKTTDSGKVWERLVRDNNFSYLGYTHEDIFVQNSNQFWLGGDYGVLELNTNTGGGITIPRSLFRVDTTGLYIANTVKLVNYSKPNYQYQWYVNHSLVSTSYHTTYTHNIYLGQDTVMLVVSNGTYNDTLVQYPEFTAVPYPAPVVTSFTPTSGSTGTVVTITGNYFNGATVVSFGDIPATSYTIVSITQITAVVGAGANGNVSVTTPTGTGSLPGFITFPPPVITSFSPLSGPVGTTVTINGTNFSAAAANNIVYFGAVKAVVTSASPTQLIVTVPVGATYRPVSVTVNNHTAYSALPFILTYPAGCGFTANSFVPAASTGNGGVKLVLSDFDGDGKVDMATANTFSGLIISRNTSTPGKVSYASPKTYVANYHSNVLATADLDGDGLPEIVLGNYSGNSVSVFKNTSTPGNISFAPNIDYPILSTPGAIVLTDLDGDGKPDMVVSNSNDNIWKFSIYRNTSVNGQVSFVQKANVSLDGGPVLMVAGDLNGDNKPDLIVTTNNSFAYKVYKNTSIIGEISFATPTSFGNTVGVQVGIAMSDLDGDNKLDVVVLHDGHYSIEGKSLTLYKNISTTDSIKFGPKKMYHDDMGPDDLTIADMDGDSKPDILAAYGFFGNLFVYKNTSNADSLSIAWPGTYLPSYGNSVGVADLDSDGKPDITSGVTTYRNTIGERGALAGTDTTICNGRNLFIGRNSDQYFTYAWNSSPAGFTSTQANPVVSPTVTTKYYVTVTSRLGCVATDSIIVSVGTIPPVIDAGISRAVCPGITAQIGSAPVSGNTYSWTSIPYGFTSSSPNPVVNPDISTDYILTVSNASCTLKDTVTIGIYPVPPLYIGPDFTACRGRATSLGTTGSGSYTYSWTSNPAGFTSANAVTTAYPDVTTSYYLTVSNGFCSRTDTIVVTVVDPPAANAGADKTICAGSNTTIGTAGVSGNTYVWLSDIGAYSAVIATPTVNPTVTTKYYLTVSNGSCITRDTVLVTVLPPANAGADKVICSGTNTTIGTPAVSGNTYSWTSNPAGFTSASANPTVNPAVTTQYFLSVVNIACTTLDTVIITVNSSVSPSIVLSGTTTVNQGQATVVTANITNAGTSPTYQWQDSTSTSGWKNINGVIGATLNYTPAKTGDKVRCKLISSAACSTSDTVVSASLIFTVNNVTGINPVPAASYGINWYPNPVVSGTLYIDSLRLADKWQTLEITGIDGRKNIAQMNIANKTSINVNVTELQSGYYVIILRRKQGLPVYLKFLKL